MGEPGGSHLEEPDGIRITVNYKKLDKISNLGDLPIPRVDERLRELGTGRISSLFELVSTFCPETVHKNTVPLTAFCTPTCLFTWVVRPHGRSAAPSWSDKVINELIKGPDCVAAYHDDVSVFGADPSRHLVNHEGVLPAPAKAHPQAFPFKGYHRCRG